MIEKEYLVEITRLFNEYAKENTVTYSPSQEKIIISCWGFEFVLNCKTSTWYINDTAD